MPTGLNDAALNIGVDAMIANITHLSIHTAEPDGAGSNESTAARVAHGMGAAANGDFPTVTNLAFTGGASSGPATHLGLWSAITGGVFRGYFALTGDQTFNAAGEYTVTSLSLPGSSS